MNLPCEVIQDLMPLYQDQVCSDETRKLVELHISECESCRNKMNTQTDVCEENIEISMENEQKAVKKCFYKIRRRWGISLIAVLLICFIGFPAVVLTVNQIRGEGVCYSNVDDIKVAKGFIDALEQEEFDKLVSMMDFSEGYQSITEALAMTESDYIPRYIPVSIGGEKWMASEEVYSLYFEKEEEFSWEDGIWEYSTFMIPVTAWNEIVEKNPDRFLELNGDIYTVSNDDIADCYIQIQTEWGDFMVRRAYGMTIHIDGSEYTGSDTVIPEISETLTDSTASEICGFTGLVPEAIYNDALLQWQINAKEFVNSTQEYYKEVKEMSLEQYCLTMQQRHKGGLERCIREGYKIKNAEYKNCQYDEITECWIIAFDIDIIFKNEIYDVSIILSVRDKMINDIDMRSGIFFYRENMFQNALSLYYSE